jgi:hypothetical protein
MRSGDRGAPGSDQVSADPSDSQDGSPGEAPTLQHVGGGGL